MDGARPFAESLIGKRVAGRYVVERVIGWGGMGVVTAARYPELAQKVAIKFLRPEHAANEILAARFVREARLAAKVRSDHFVRVFDIGRIETGVPYLVMEMLAGRDLGDELAATGPLTVEGAVDFVLQATVGIAEIHAMGVVHRDLKPSNLFLAEAAGGKTIKVLDFGISKESARGDKPLTSTDNVLGTPQYMSPEQVKASRDVDVRSDIWALGVILYELLTTKQPFVSEEGGVGELFAKVLYVDPIPPREHRPDLPAELDGLIMKCLTRAREGRFANVADFAEALRPFAGPASVHRVETVRRALEAPRDVDAEDREEVPERRSQAPTALSSPKDGPKDAIAHAPTAPSERHDRSQLGASEPMKTARTPSAAVATSLATTSQAIPSPPKHRFPVAALVVLGIAIAGGAGIFAFTRGDGPKPASSPSASAGSNGGLAATTATPTVGWTGAAAFTTPGAGASGSGASGADAKSDGGTATAAEPAATSGATAKPVRPGPPHVPPKPIVSAKPSATPSAAPTSTALILDRK